METNLNTFDRRLEDHFAKGCPDGENLKQFYADSLNNTRNSVQRCRKIIVDRPWTSLCCDKPVQAEMYETVDDFIILVNVHFASCPGNMTTRSRTPLSDILEE
ncbi:hypothetical protein FO519_003338 [Halicephalobus sp. NKZ332]|nr:hypothetical protein FO519_003338 [Halicephalobus sp. NKZ332]